MSTSLSPAIRPGCSRERLTTLRIPLLARAHRDSDDPPIGVFVARYAIEARRSGRTPEAMIVDLKALYAEATVARGAAQLWSASRPEADDLLDVLVSLAIRCYYSDEAAA